MPKKPGKRARKTDRATSLEPGAVVPNDPQSESFVRSLIENGQAAKPGPGGELPPGATHEIIGATAEGKPIVIRRRFSAT